MTVWFITGASRGLGLDIARTALEHGDTVVATSRSGSLSPGEPSEAHDRLLVLPLDVTDGSQARAAVRQATDRFGRIDVVVNNAGFGIVGAIEETDDDEVRALFEVNVFGLLNVTRAVLPVLREQRGGHLINIGSVGGFTQGAGSGIYGASKFAVEGITEALHGELAGLGISVSVIEPGQLRTDFFEATSLRPARTVIDDYTPTAGARREAFTRLNGHQIGDPVKAAQVIVGLAHEPCPPLRLPLGTDSLSRIEAKLECVTKEISAWRDVTVSTDFDDADRSPMRTPAVPENAGG